MRRSRSRSRRRLRKTGGFSYGSIRGSPALLRLALQGAGRGVTADSIDNTFFVAAGTFAAVSAFGATTKRDLTGIGHFMMMGLFGIIIASFANLLLASDGLGWVTSFLAVFIFTGLTAYHTQQILAQNVLGNEGTDEDVKEAISGALALYLDFINLFLNLLRLMGRRR